MSVSEAFKHYTEWMGQLIKHEYMQPRGEEAYNIWRGEKKRIEENIEKYYKMLTNCHKTV